jgi:hypothetical protein
MENEMNLFGRVSGKHRWNDVCDVLFKDGYVFDESNGLLKKNYGKKKKNRKIPVQKTVRHINKIRRYEMP